MIVFGLSHKGASSKARVETRIKGGQVAYGYDIKAVAVRKVMKEAT